MHITGKNGTYNVFSGTDILSESGVATGYEAYAGGFDFSGKITTLIIEVGGRDINLAIGPLFDDVTVNVLYNVVNTIVTQSIESVEMLDCFEYRQRQKLLIIENIFDHNDFIIFSRWRDRVLNQSRRTRHGSFIRDSRDGDGDAGNGN